MPLTPVVLYMEEDGSVPLLEWLRRQQPRAIAKCRVGLERLAEMGHDLRRPEADYLRDGVYELRIGLQGIHYRILFFFHGNRAAVVSHGLKKERRVPAREIDRAIERKRRFEANPERHTYRME